MIMFFAGICKTKKEGWAAYHVHREYGRSRLDIC